MNGCLVFILVIVAFVILFTNPALSAVLTVGFVIWLIARYSSKQTQNPSNTPTPTYSTKRETSQYNNNSNGNFTSHGQSRMEWRGSGRSITIGSYAINNPLTYYSNSNTRYDDASCIASNLPVGRPVSEPHGSLGYWPSYSRMSPNQRANYLNWLSSGKKSKLDDIGYVFVYFYGLERRALVDKQDLNLIIDEVNRLLKAYPFSGSFNGYASRLISFINAQKYINSMAPDSDEIKKLMNDLVINGDELALSVILASIYKSTQSLTNDMAFVVAKHDIRTPRSVVVDRVPEQFQTLFAHKYHQKFGAGIKLKVSANDLTIYYRAASPTFADSRSANAIPPIRIPNVLGIQSQFKPLVEIWKECIEELRPLNREVTKGSQIDSRDVYRALPEALKAGIEHPDKEKWEKIISDYAKGSGVLLIPILALATIQGFEPRPKLTFKQSEDLALTANEVGYMMIPDPRITCRSYGWDDVVAIIRPIDKPTLPTDELYRSASLMLELGIAMAASDGHIDGEEINHIVHTLESQFMLEPQDVHRLEAYREVLVNQPPSITTIAKRLSTVLKETQKEILGKYLIGVMTSDGIIHKKEINVIQKVYAALGLNPDHVDQIIKSITQNEPITIQTGKISKGEPIPKRFTEEQTHVVLNHDLLKQIMADTAAVSHILGQALCDTEAAAVDDLKNNSIQQEQPTTPHVNINIGVSKELIDNLDFRFHHALADLLSQKLWSPPDIDALARKHSLMPANMIDAINTWSDEYLGDFLIEEGQEYSINISLLEEQK